MHKTKVKPIISAKTDKKSDDGASCQVSKIFSKYLAIYKNEEDGVYSYYRLRDKRESILGADSIVELNFDETNKLISTRVI
jgi:hypothetical protein